MAVDRPPFVTGYTVPTHGERDPQYIVLHTTEGNGTVESFSHYFHGTAAGLGATFLVEKRGRAGMYCRLDDRTYHVAGHNTQCIGIEQVGTASTSKAGWMLKRRQVYMTAWIVAWLCDQLNIPAIAAGHDVKGKPVRQFTHSRGVTQHRWVPDNNHVDCGTGYPFDLVLELANKWLKTGGPTKSTRFFLKFGHRP